MTVGLQLIAGTQPDYSLDTQGTWEDIIGKADSLVKGLSDPTYTVFKDSFRAFRFDNNKFNEIWFTFHMPHGINPATGCHVHVHWSDSDIDAATVGDVQWDIKYMTARAPINGVTGIPFSSESTISLAPTSCTTQYAHMVTESVTPILVGQLGVDSLVLVHLSRNGGVGLDSSNGSVFAFQMDLHVRTTKLGTKYKDRSVGDSFYGP
jgi:hypothetical protein